MADDGIDDAAESGWDDLEAIAEDEQARNATDEVDTVSRARRGALVAGRALGGLIGAGVAAAVIVGLSVLPLPTIASPVTTVVLEPTELPRTLVCPDGAVVLGNDPVAAELRLSTLGKANRQVAGSPQATTSLNPAAGAEGGSGPQAIQAAGTGLSVLHAAQAQRVNRNRLQGFVATGCVTASYEQWLVGGSTAVGRTSLIQLTNPGETSATVSLRAYGSDGEAGATDGLVVAPGAERIVSLASFARSLDDPVIRVQSTGSPVAAQLQTTVERSLAPGGADQFAAISQPVNDSVIVGVRIAGAEAVAQASLGEGMDDLAPVLRLFSPTGAAASVEVQITALPNTAAPNAPTGVVATLVEDLAAEAVLEVPLNTLPDGQYQIRVRSEVPVLAAARVSYLTSAGSELVWQQASPWLDGTIALAVAQGPGARIVIAAEDDASVSLTGPQGTSTVTVPQGGTVIPAEAGAWSVVSDLPIAIAVVYSGQSGGAAAYPVPGAPAAADAVTVHY